MDFKDIEIFERAVNLANLCNQRYTHAYVPI